VSKNLEIPTEEVGASNNEDDQECPTVPPPFDFEAYAKEIASKGEDESLEGNPHTRITPRSGIERVQDKLATMSEGYDASELIAQADTDERVRDTFATIPDGYDAIDLNAARASADAVTAHEMNDRVAAGDYAGALDIANKLVAMDGNDISARVCAETCQMVLRQMYAARIGPLSRVPVVMVPRDQFRWLSIDHRAGFMLSLIDGASTLEMLLDLSAMPELDTLKILSDLAQQRIISFK